MTVPLVDYCFTVVCDVARTCQRRVEDAEKRGLCVPLLINTMWSAKLQRTGADLPGEDFECEREAHNRCELVQRNKWGDIFKGLDSKEKPPRYIQKPRVYMTFCFFI